MGKGSVQRPTDKKKYDENYDRIFKARKAAPPCMIEKKCAWPACKFCSVRDCESRRYSSTLEDEDGDN